MNQDEINSIAEKIIDAAGKLKVEGQKIFDKDEFGRLKEHESRWHEISMNQLSFYNNLLIVLGTGFLAFVIKEFKPTALDFSFNEMDWYPTAIGVSIATMTGATLFGLFCGFNRLVDFRYTHRINNFRRKLYQ